MLPEITAVGLSVSRLLRQLVPCRWSARYPLSLVLGLGANFGRLFRPQWYYVRVPACFGYTALAHFFQNSLRRQKFLKHLWFYSVLPTWLHHLFLQLETAAALPV